MANHRSTNSPGGINGTFTVPWQSGSSIVQWARSVYVPRERPKQRRPSMVLPADDGYLRKTPVQEIHEPKGYRGRIIKRAVAIVVGLAFVAAVIYVLLTFIVNY